METEGVAQIGAERYERSEERQCRRNGYRERGPVYPRRRVVCNGERAGKILPMLNPIEHTCDEEAVWRYDLELCVVAADVYRLPEQIGRGGWSWYTGSAAWMYRAWVEEVLGLKVRGDRMQLNPVIPGWWEGFHLSYRHGEAIYEIQVENPEGCERGVSWVEMDGQRMPHGVIQLRRDLVKHRILVHMGRPENLA